MHFIRLYGGMRQIHRAALLAATLVFCAHAMPATAAGSKTVPVPSPTPSQETGFLNRTVEVQGVSYKFQVYLPEDYRRPQEDEGPQKFPSKKADKFPIILFLHGRGERGSEGMWQTQIGLPEEIRDHPERWPFIVVMPQCPLHRFWTDPDMLQMAIATLDQEQREFHADADRTYLAGLSLGGYGAWELARVYPHRWAAIALVSTGIFWSYAPDRWREIATLPADYARAVGHTPVWMFHGTQDTTVPPRESEVMFDALKAENGHVRLWEYQGLYHDSWTRAFNEAELPRWLLSHRASQNTQLPSLAEHLMIPLHPPGLKLATALLDSYVGDYHDSTNVVAATIQRQGEQLYLKNPQGEVMEIQAETPSTFFYAAGGLTRLTFEHDPQGRVTALLYRNDRDEERWEKKR